MTKNECRPVTNPQFLTKCKNCKGEGAALIADTNITVGMFPNTDNHWIRRETCYKCGGSGYLPYLPEWTKNSDVKMVLEGILKKHGDRLIDSLDIKVLSDVLKEAGCDNKDILEHLDTDNRTHSGDCWALKSLGLLCCEEESE